MNERQQLAELRKQVAAMAARMAARDNEVAGMTALPPSAPGRESGDANIARIFGIAPSAMATADLIDGISMGGDVIMKDGSRRAGRELAGARGGAQ